MIKYTNNCPVCGYELWFLPWENDSPSDEICPSCGIQFGYTDAAGGNEDKRLQLYKDWRSDWIKHGMVWDKGRSSPPENWDPKIQLENVPPELK